MSLLWYACISTNTYHFETHHISLETDWWALPNASSIVQIRSAIHEILADKAFIATNGLISQLFVVAFVHSAYVRIVLIWGFPVQLGLWKSVHWLWRYKLNEVCDNTITKLAIFLASLLKIDSLAISVLNPVLDLEITVSFIFYSITTNTSIYIYTTIICLFYCLNWIKIWSRILCWLMLYTGNKLIGIDNNNSGSSLGEERYIGVR